MAISWCPRRESLYFIRLLISQLLSAVNGLLKCFPNLKCCHVKRSAKWNGQTTCCLFFKDDTCHRLTKVSCIAPNITQTTKFKKYKFSPPCHRIFKWTILIGTSACTCYPFDQNISSEVLSTRKMAAKVSCALHTFRISATLLRIRMSV
jgi:hypothetical protein